LSQIFNKSSHPVAIKRIPIRMWTLRAEIEAALEHRIKECEAAGVPLYIDDIKEFYGMNIAKPLSGQPQLKLVEASEASESTQMSNENIDDMMAALAEEKAPEATPETPPQEAATAEAASAPEAASTETPPSAQADQIIATQSPEEKAQAPHAHKFQTPYVRRAPNSDQISYGFSMLADINMDWVLAFSKHPFTQGSSIVIEFLIPNPFTMNVEIVLCNRIAMKSRIISETKPDYRVQCRYTFSHPGERSNLRRFLSSVEPDLPNKPPLLTSSSAEDTGPAT
jgi:hypothetical protein